MTAEESGVRRAFVAALILTENAVAAEAAVMDAIATSGCEIYELLVATAKCAIQIRHHCSPRPKIFFSLPPELQGLLLLPLIARRCFVSRVLIEFTRETTSGILDLRRDEVDDALCQALSDLSPI